MQYPATIAWRKDEVFTVASSEALVAALDRFERDALADPEWPLLAEFVDRDGNSLTVGIAPHGPYFEFVSKEIRQQQHYTDLVCVGDEEAEGTVDFLLCGHHSELDRRNLIPVEAMKEAVRQYLESGELSKRIRWEYV